MGARSTDSDDHPPKIAPYTTRALDGLKRDAAKLGAAVGEFAQRLFESNHPWSKIRQGHKPLRVGERYTPQRLDAACRHALDVDFIDVKRLERILAQALEEETSPQLPLPMPPGRFARPGSAFALITGGQWLLDAAFSLGFLDRHEHVLLVGPAGVGKSFLAQALG